MTSGKRVQQSQNNFLKSPLSSLEMAVIQKIICNQKEVSAHFNSLKLLFLRSNKLNIQIKTLFKATCLNLVGATALK